MTRAAHPTPSQGVDVTIADVASDWSDRCSQLEAIVEAQQLDLQKYGRHLLHCPAWSGGPRVCGCGYVAALARPVPR